MNIVLFGGAFDPPHIGHQKITEALIENKIADEVWYVPTKKQESAFSKNMSSVKHRLAMLGLVVESHHQAGFVQTRVETYELEKDGLSYTYETLDYLSAKYPEHNFSWIIGSDNLAKFHTWDGGQSRSYDEMLADYKFYVYPRQGASMEPLYGNMESLAEIEGIKEVVCSSTETRENINIGKSISGLVDKKVEKYIEEQNLYVKN